MKRKSKYPCSQCVHNDPKGCKYQIDNGISKEYLSKKGNHSGCFKLKGGAGHDE
jgi:hypothetical protein